MVVRPRGRAAGPASGRNAFLGLGLTAQANQKLQLIESQILALMDQKVVQKAVLEGGIVLFTAALVFANLREVYKTARSASTDISHPIKNVQRLARSRSQLIVRGGLAAIALTLVAVLPLASLWFLLCPLLYLASEIYRFRTVRRHLTPLTKDSDTPLW